MRCHGYRGPLKDEMTIDRAIHTKGSACKALTMTSVREASIVEFRPAGSADREVSPVRNCDPRDQISRQKELGKRIHMLNTSKAYRSLDRM